MHKTVPHIEIVDHHLACLKRFEIVMLPTHICKIFAAHVNACRHWGKQIMEIVTWRSCRKLNDMHFPAKVHYVRVDKAILKSQCFNDPGYIIAHKRTYFPLFIRHYWYVTNCLTRRQRCDDLSAKQDHLKIISLYYAINAVFLTGSRLLKNIIFIRRRLWFFTLALFLYMWWHRGFESGTHFLWI